MAFYVIPAVDLKEGKCVRLVRGDPRFRTVELENPVEVAKRWEDLGAERLHLVDLDGALQGVRHNSGVTKDIVGALEIPVQFGGGIRSFEDACRLLDMGVEKIIIGTAAMEDPALLDGLGEKYGRDRLIVALDSKKGRVVTRGWVDETGETPMEAAKRFEGRAAECLYTNVDVEGMTEGIELSAIKKMVEATSMGVIASGGVTGLQDIEDIKSAGAKGVVIGTALYKGLIDFEEALKIQENPS